MGVEECRRTPVYVGQLTSSFALISALADVDMFAWTTNPGEPGGPCRPGAPKTGVFWPAYALPLVHDADFNIR